MKLFFSCTDNNKIAQWITDLTTARERVYGQPTVRPLPTEPRSSVTIYRTRKTARGRRFTHISLNPLQPGNRVHPQKVLPNEGPRRLILLAMSAPHNGH